MNSIERRKALVSFLYSAAAISTLPGILVASSTSQRQIPDINIPLLRELKMVSYAWFKKYNQDPRQYLKSAGLEKIISPDQISSLTVSDFENNNTIEIEGLVLGKTESAILVSLFLCVDCNDDGLK